MAARFVDDGGRYGYGYGYGYGWILLTLIVELLSFVI